MRKKILNIALSLTLVRLFLSPIFLVLYLYHDSLSISLILLPYLLLVLSGISELTDLFDGYFARRYNQVTDLGKLLDPMADSVFRLSMFFTFTQGIVQLPLLLVLLFFYRDTLIGTLRTLCALRGIALAARMSGKIKAVIQGCVAIVILILLIPYSLGYLSLGVLQSISFYLVLLTVLYTLYSGVEYIHANRSYIKNALSS